MTPTRRTLLATGLAGAAVSAAGGVCHAAAPVRGVIELFTSQGCSSCPPADRLAASLARDPGLVVLSLPVDYWDSLGWHDTFAQHAFTARQYAYAQGRGDGEVYTPQAVVNGAAHAVGSDRAGILDLAAQPLPVSVALSGDGLVVSGSGGGTAQILALPILRARAVAIGRGENASATVTYTNIVRALTPLGAWQGGVVRLPRPDLPVDGDRGLAILVQEGSLAAPGRILGAMAL